MNFSQQMYVKSVRSFQETYYGTCTHLDMFDYTCLLTYSFVEGYESHSKFVRIGWQPG